ncbi:MAG: thioredoxin domain-containing protein [Candidatus Eisenbacteria bacterium]
MPNRLEGASSPYLLQHKENPVDWHTWGPEALERARGEDKPIFLSIGYSACHWCHVMERESFEDRETARILNEHFVSIKVDREERPDLDSIYMEAVQAMTGSGGWPMSVFLTPGAKPFFGGTYFPPEDRYGMPSFRRVLLAAAEAFRERRAEIEGQASRLAGRIGRAPVLHGGAGVDRSVSDRAGARLAEEFDEANGGFGGAPKFPQPMNLDFLLRRSRRTGDREALRRAVFTLDRMARGGSHDHVGGGFHRYSTDPRWLVPHFEKMLYDNALLARLYLNAYQHTGRPLFREVARGVLDYVLREMTGARGGFYSSEDADSEGGEGRFFTWTPDEIRRALGEEEGNLFSLAYGATKGGHLEGRSIPNRLGDSEELALRAGIPRAELETVLRRGRERLFSEREGRIRPGRDEKVLAGWNGLMLAAFAEAARVLDDPRYLEAAERNASFIEEALMKDGRLLRVWKDGAGSSPLGFLEDHAFLGEGLLALYQTGFDERWFRLARTLGDAILERFSDREEGGFHDTGTEHEALVARPKGVQDNAVPSGNAAAARLLLLLAAYTGEERYASPARRAVASMQELMERHPSAFGHWLGSLELLLSPPREVAIVGGRESPDTGALLLAAFGAYNPNQVVALRDPREKESSVPLLEGKPMVDGAASAYVCRSFTCQAPITNPEKLATELAS